MWKNNNNVKTYWIKITIFSFSIISLSVILLRYTHSVFVNFFSFTHIYDRPLNFVNIFRILYLHREIAKQKKMWVKKHVKRSVRTFQFVSLLSLCRSFVGIHQGIHCKWWQLCIRFPFSHFYVHSFYWFWHLNSVLSLMVYIWFKK